MSKDKHRSHDRAARLLVRLFKAKHHDGRGKMVRYIPSGLADLVYSRPFGSGLVASWRESRMTKDVDRLIERGLIARRRDDPWSRQRRTYLEITPAGEQAVFDGDLGLPKPVAKSRKKPEKRGRYV